MTAPPLQPQVPSGQGFDEADFKKRLMDEWKVLQDKMDKIGSFGFTIKGWSVTAVIAGTAAANASSSLVAVLMISVGLAFMMGFFCWFEFKQVRLSRLFGDRARKLEASFKLLDSGRLKAASPPIAVPYTAHEIALASFRQRVSGVQGSRGSYKITKLRDGWAGQWPVLKQADIYFYGTLILLAFLLPLLPKLVEVVSRRIGEFPGVPVW